MRISIEKTSNDTFLIEVPCKQEKGKKNEPTPYKEDLKYTANTEEEALTIIKEALKEIKTPEDEYGLSFDQAIAEPSQEKGKAPKVG